MITTAVLTPILTVFISKRKKTLKAEIKKQVEPREKEKILIVADDLTGSADTCVQFSKKGYRSTIITENKNILKTLPECDVLVIDTETRATEHGKAYKKVFETGQVVNGLKFRCIYKKIDSTFRGNAGAEITALMDSLQIRHALVVPSYPANYRTAINGTIRIGGILLSETEFSRDPKTPVKESYIPGILSTQTKKSIRLIGIDEVRSGDLRNKLVSMMTDFSGLIIIDAENNRDLDTIAEATSGLQVLFAGSSGLAEFIPDYLDAGVPKRINLMIAGSASEVTRKQTDYAREKGNIAIADLDIVNLLNTGSLSEKKRLLDLAHEASRKGVDLIIRSAPYSDSVQNSYKEGQLYGKDASAVNESVSSFLGETAAEILREIDVGGLVLTGGDTAIHVADALKISGINIRDEIQPGIPYGYFIDKEYGTIPVVTKAGGFGTENAVVEIFEFLRKKACS
jgi:uncharacterized protein YgbK (DUF1537 family)